MAAASEARVAVEAAAQLEAAMAAADLAKGGAEAALLAREVAEIEAATAAHEAQEVLLAMAEDEAVAEAAAEVALAATVAAKMAADDAVARATPTPMRPSTMRVTPEGVDYAVTRSAAAKKAALEAKAPRLAREAAAAAKAAMDRAASVAAMEEDELVEAAAEGGCAMARPGLRKLLAATGCRAEEFRSLGGLGEAGYEAVLADVVEAGYRLTALEKVLLKKYVAPECEAPRDSGARRQGRMVDIDIEEVVSVASTESDMEVPAPPQAARVRAPAAAAVSRPASRVGELVSLLRPSEACTLIEFARDAVLEALLGRAARKVELQKPEAALELWLEKELGMSAEECKAAASSDLDAMEAWLMGVIYEAESERRGRKGGGGGGGGGGAAASEGGEAATLAAMIAAGGASSTQDPALLEALKEAALDPSVKVRLERVKKLFSEGKPVEAAALLSEINERPCMAAVYYKAGEVKHVQGSSVVPGANAVVVLVGAVRESVEMDVARQVQGMLPPTCDARELARKLTRGRVDEVSFESIFGSKSGSSVMMSAVKAEKVKGGVDATSDSYLMVMRGMALLMVGYARAHPFDGEAANEWARLLSDLARAVQDGLSLEASVAVILDPVCQELSLEWKDVARGATLLRPRMKAVMERTKEKRSFHLRQRLEMQRRETPAAGRGGGGGGGASGGGGATGVKGEVDALKKVQKQAEEALRVAKAASAAKTANKAPGKQAENPAREWLAEDAANADKCFYFSKRGKCTQGKDCKFFGGTPGHNE